MLLTQILVYVINNYLNIQLSYEKRKDLKIEKYIQNKRYVIMKM